MARIVFRRKSKEKSEKKASPWSEASSTRIISSNSGGGVRLTTLRMLRRSADRASLWKQKMTEAVGS